MVTVRPTIKRMVSQKLAKGRLLNLGNVENKSYWIQKTRGLSEVQPIQRRLTRRQIETRSGRRVEPSR